MTQELWLRDPTAETTPLRRPRTTPPKSLEGLT
ncbi:MAG TPA: UGSC family (seleno)protein, partial [Burkholderiales bacterium]|nr:UGSC family (seleno)protein [Burkholderiales bacterium]